MDPKLLVKINGDPSGVVQAFRVAGGEAEKLTGLVGKIGAASLAGIGLAAIPAFINRTADGIDALNDLGDTTGSTIEKLSSLEDTTIRTGNSFASMQTTLVKFNAVLKEADGKNGVSQALKAIGLSADELRRLDPVDALVEVAQALGRYADNGDKARLVQELFGKSAAEVAPLLKDLAEKGLAVATVTTKQAKEAETYNKQLAELSKNSTDFARSLTSAVLPALNEVLKGLTSGGLRGGIDAFGELIGLGKEYYTKRSIGQVADDVAKLQSRLALAGSFGDTSYSKSLKVELDAKVAELKGLESTLQKLNSAGARGRRPLNEGGGGYNPPAVKFSVPTSGEKKEKAIDPLDAADKRISDALEKYVEKDLDLQQKRVEADRTAQSRRLDSAIEFGIQLQDQTEELTASLIVDEEARGNALIELDRKRMSERIDSLGVAHNIELQLYDQLNANIVARQAQLTEALKPEYQKQLDSFADLMGYMKRFNDNFLTGFIDSGRDAFAEWQATGKISAKGLTDYIRREFSRLVYDRYLASLTAQAGNTILSGISSLFGGAAGATNGNAGQNYGGQVVNNPSAYVAPLAEGTNYIPYDGFLASLHKGERVTPAKFNPDAGGSESGKAINLSPTYNIGQGVSRGEVYQAVRAANAELMEKLRRSKSRGGEFA